MSATTPAPATAPAPAPATAAPPPVKDINLKILAQDPDVFAVGTERALRAEVPVPYDSVLTGPRSSRFAVVDYDATANVLHPPTDLALSSKAFDTLDDAALFEDRAFRAQNVYAIASRTLGAFELALGRRVPWSFSGHQLNLVPAAFGEANAYYDPESNAIMFGYFPGSVRAPGKRRRPATVYTCLSHDIVAHETTHAVLDGLRSRFQEPGLPDQMAFHEAFADVVALLSVFSVKDLVETALGEADPNGRIPASQVEEKTLSKGILLGLAEQMGEATKAHTGGALRRSIELPESTDWVEDPGFDEPHLRGEFLVAAMMRTFVSIWHDRVVPLISPDGVLDRSRAAEEGRKAAQHLLQMAIRAIDYTPPIELEFGDYIEAMLVSDAVMAPNDEHGYRGRLRERFAKYGIVPGDRLSDIGALPFDYGSINAAELHARTDELFRFLWQNADAVGLRRGYYATVDDLIPTTRVGPDGLVVQEVIGTYRQMLNGTYGELLALSKGSYRVDGLADATPIQIHGGGTVIFDQYGRAKYHMSKPIFDWTRQRRRLEYLVRNGMTDTSGRYGFSPGVAEGQRFAVLHDARIDREEVW